MKRPDVPAMTELESTLQKIKDMEDVINVLKKKLKRQVGEIAHQLDDNDKKEAAQYLYWVHSELSAGDIAKSFFDTTGNRLSYIIGSTYTTPCRKCGEPVVIKSRMQLKALSSSGIYCPSSYYICDSCDKESTIKSHKEWIEKEEAKKDRLLELKKMPYKEYLTTPEWQETRKAQLKRANYRCQVCNSNEKSLNVHHRTYENRGEETYKDLIVLCQDCHETFHSNGKITD
jgi:5-methylcytosine-specific restriction endonuclease McrA